LDQSASIKVKKAALAKDGAAEIFFNSHWKIVQTQYFASMFRIVKEECGIVRFYNEKQKKFCTWHL
jgi:hypothetical protein